MTSRRVVLRVEELGSRELPSVTPLVPPALAHGVAAVATPPQPHHHAPSGHGQGQYTIAATIPDAGTTYHLDGDGHFGRLGAVDISGDLHSVGFIINGHAGGTLTLANARGSVTLQLEGPSQTGPSALPERFHFKITGGTGAYQHLHGHGTLHLHLGTPDSTGHGTFKIRL
jgi:hypothetical protein